MRIRQLTILAIAFALVAAVVAGQGTDATIVQNSAPDKFQTIPNVPKCLTAAVQQGDPAKGPSVLLIKGTAGCKAPWHWHTPNEQVMMVSGRGQVEMKGQQPVLLRAGGFAAAPSSTRMSSLVLAVGANSSCTLTVHSIFTTSIRTVKRSRQSKHWVRTKNRNPPHSGQQSCVD
jgi:quercetin dioxygenase-like cupin family protein